jgi:hypothetical protein
MLENSTPFFIHRDLPFFSPAYTPTAGAGHDVIEQPWVSMLENSTVAAKLGIRKAKRIEAWVPMYRQEGELSFHKPIGRPLKS